MRKSDIFQSEPEKHFRNFPISTQKIAFTLYVGWMYCTDVPGEKTLFDAGFQVLENHIARSYDISSVTVMGWRAVHILH